MPNTYRVFVTNEDDLYNRNNVKDTFTLQANSFFEALKASYKKYNGISWLDIVDINLLKGESEDFYNMKNVHRVKYTDASTQMNEDGSYIEIGCKYTSKLPRKYRQTYDFYFPDGNTVEESQSFTENEKESISEQVKVFADGRECYCYPDDDDFVEIYD